jgi:hypothetical protein
MSTQSLRLANPSTECSRRCFSCVKYELQERSGFTTDIAMYNNAPIYMYSKAYKVKERLPLLAANSQESCCRCHSQTESFRMILM